MKPGAITLALFKPDAVRRYLVGAIVTEIERAGLVLCDLSITTMSRDQAAVFYAEHLGQMYFEELVRFTISGPLYVALLSGQTLADGEVIQVWRKRMGPSNPARRPPDTIRGRYAVGCPGDGKPRARLRLARGPGARAGALVRSWGYL